MLRPPWLLPIKVQGAATRKVARSFGEAGDTGAAAGRILAAALALRAILTG